MFYQNSFTFIRESVRRTKEKKSCFTDEAKRVLKQSSWALGRLIASRGRGATLH